MGCCHGDHAQDARNTEPLLPPKTGFYADDYFKDLLETNKQIFSSSSSSEKKISEEEYASKYFRLTSPKTEMEECYDAIVIGSGYGGGIAAARLSRAGFKTCILEKGKEWIHGSFPDGSIAPIKEIRIHNKNGMVGINNPNPGLWNFYVGNVVSIYAHGLGGTSLMNASVCLEPVEQFWDLDGWPKEIKNEYKENKLKEYWKKAEIYLNPKPYPYKSPNKYNALKFVEETVKENIDDNIIKDIEDLGDLYRTPLYVTFNDDNDEDEDKEDDDDDNKRDDDDDKKNNDNDRDRFNKFGVYQEGCVSCGNCFSGCNVSAKNTIDKNFLPDAKSFGCKIFTKCNVRRIEVIIKDEDGYNEGYKYRVYFNNGGNKYYGNEIFIKAKIVVVAAGCVGTNEIMLRSAQNGLKLSKHLGSRFSVNGDQFGVVYNSEHKCDVIGWNKRIKDIKDFSKEPQIGASITGVVDMRTNNNKYEYKKQYVIEDGSPPGIGNLPNLYKIALIAGNLIIGEDEQTLQQEIESKIRTITGENISNTMTLLSMSFDDSSGYFKINNNDNLEIYFPDASKQIGYNILDDIYKKIAVKMNGDFIADPLWNPIISKKEKKGLTVHPLGGCFMAENINIGVVNHKGQFFRDYDEKEEKEKNIDSDENGNYIYSGLYCTDAALIPYSICVNPTYTISTLAERVMFNLLKDYKKINDINDEKVYIIKNKDKLSGSSINCKPIITIKHNYKNGKILIGNEEKESFANIIIGDDDDITNNNKWSNDFEANIIIEINDAISYDKYPISGCLKCKQLSSSPMKIINASLKILKKPTETIFEYEFYLLSVEGYRYIVLGVKKSEHHNLYLMIFKSKTELTDDTELVHDVRLNMLHFVARIVLKMDDNQQHESIQNIQCDNVNNQDQENQLIKKYAAMFN